MEGKTFAELHAEIEAEEEQTAKQHTVGREYLEHIDGKLVEQEWAYAGAKTVAFGYQDQSLLNHVRNGVYFLLQLNQAATALNARTLGETELRNAIAMFVAHDLHKTRETDGPEEEFDISRETVEEFVNDVGLEDFAPELMIDDYWSCACAHHDSWNAKTGHVTLAFTELQGYVRLADSFASTSVPEEAVDERTQKNFDDVFYGQLDLRYHQLNDVKGILTNLCNRAVEKLLRCKGYQVLAIYQDGCVYAVPADVSEPSLDEELIRKVYETFTDTVRDAHPSYANPSKLMDSIGRGRLGYYDPSPEDFFYAGPSRVLRAMVRKAAMDGDTDDPPTESMSKSIEKVDAEVPITLDDTRQLVGVARLVYGVQRTIVPELEKDETSLIVTCNLFSVREDVREALVETRERDSSLLKSGGKWEYSYAIGQELLDRMFDGKVAKTLPPAQFVDAVAEFLLAQLEAYDGWETIEEAFTDDIRDELLAYLSDILIVDGRSSRLDTGLTDPYDEYTSSRSGKLCTLCNRGTTSSRKSDMETKKSLSTLQAGFSNRTEVGAGKPEKLLLCSPCRIELSLRETGSSRREAGRLFFHFTPDYFFTPLSWELTRRLFDRYDGSSRVRMSHLAERVFTDDASEKAYRTVLENLTRDEGGMTMVENLAQGFDEGFGALQMGYFKPHTNETEYQFFGVYLALVIASHTGLRVLVSENPVPELRGRDFDELARLGAGMTPVKRFYGDAVELDELDVTLKRASALIQLGYANEHDDALFAKHLRTTRNKPLPGSHLLKRLAQADPDEGSRAAWNLMDEARYLDVTTGVSTND